MSLGNKRAWNYIIGSNLINSYNLYFDKSIGPGSQLKIETVLAIKDGE